MTVHELAARLTGEHWMGKVTNHRRRPTGDEIARLAYQFYEARGRRNGHDVEDWLLAERELARRYRP